MEKLSGDKENKIVVLVGNGFDIQILKHFKSTIDTSYPSFYNFLNWKYAAKVQNNVIIQKMKGDKELGKESWSDFENTIKEIIKREYETKEEIFDNEQYISALSELQNCFTDFLNTIVTSELLSKVDKLGKIFKAPEFGGRESLPLNTMQSFIGDLTKKEREKLQFKLKISHHNIIDFTFINFNYTPLFDNYITLDKKKFDPHGYKNSPNNFHPQLAFDGTKQEIYTQLVTRIFHPHGYQHTPRSMLFGFDNPGQIISNYKGDLYTNKEVQDYVKYFLKPYWAENDRNYKKYLDEAELFIVFGHSIGDSDRYWWQSIAQNLIQRNSELIIYNYSRNDTKEQKTRIATGFLNSAGVIDYDERYKALDKIFVVNFNEEKRRYAFNVDSKNTVE